MDLPTILRAVTKCEILAPLFFWSSKAQNAGEAVGSARLCNAAGQKKGKSKITSGGSTKYTSRYQACISTPPLWKGGTVYSLEQIELPATPLPLADTSSFQNSRLGKLVESFIFHQLKQQDSITWICDNLQIQQEKITVGEIDALYYENETPVHLEVAYKFYLLDTLEDHQEPLAKWIGPNRKDNLALKLAKLRSKQLPLLHHHSTRPYLENLQLDPAVMEQKLCFKAQLFLPYQDQELDISPLNRKCIAGFYLPFQELQRFSTLEFFIPTKLDWLLLPHPEVAWIKYAAASTIIKASIDDQRSPLVWMKHANGEIDKCFVVFW
jgi:hypothetical protein